jgi:NAD(P)-dependent dehydrogenase (short-subunit alcohol dehydrogenase family)
MSSTLRLDGLSCVIVGGTSGIGLAAARLFLGAGARLVIAGHPDQAGAAERENLSEIGRVNELALDVAASDAIDVFFNAAVTALGGRVDVLLYAAGISGRRFGDGPLHMCSDEACRQVFAVNATGALMCNRAAVRCMMAQEPGPFRQRGSIINIGSVLDRSPAPRHFDTVAYAMSKGALRAMTLSCAARYAPEGIRFNLIEPGLVDTPMAARAARDASLVPYLRSKQPLSDGPLLAEDVASAALYLASPASRHITGATITVDGGWALCDGQDAGA